MWGGRTAAAVLGTRSRPRGAPALGRVAAARRVCSVGLSPAELVGALCVPLGERRSLRQIVAKILSDVSRHNRRINSCDSDLVALDATLLSVPCTSSAPVFCGRARASFACCSRCGAALVGGFGALCGVCAEHARVCVESSEDDHSDQNSWGHGRQLHAFRAHVGRSFVDTVSGGAGLVTVLTKGAGRSAS